MTYAEHLNNFQATRAQLTAIGQFPVSYTAMFNAIEGTLQKLVIVETTTPVVSRLKRKLSEQRA